ncbi:hypothetical protein MMC29_006470, partial [Sticta canariensis]|nr:hypothetical protein [Sticta canariensis]
MTKLFAPILSASGLMGQLIPPISALHQTAREGSFAFSISGNGLTIVSKQPFTQRRTIQSMYLDFYYRFSVSGYTGRQGMETRPGDDLGQVETVMEMVETAREEAETEKRLKAITVTERVETLLSGMKTVMKGVEMAAVMEMMVQCGMCRDSIDWNDHSTLSRGPEIQFRWVPAHINVEGNEEAVKLVKPATSDENTLPACIRVASCASKDVKPLGLNRYKRLYSAAKAGKHTRELDKTRPKHAHQSAVRPASTIQRGHFFGTNANREMLVEILPPPPFGAEISDLCEGGLKETGQRRLWTAGRQTF